MPRFKYRMQNILDIKLKLEEQAKNEYAQAQFALNVEEEKLQELKNRLLGYEAEAKQLRESTLNIQDMIANQRAIEVMKDLIKEQQKAVARAEKVLEQKRLALEEVMQERKMHEKLKEKALETFLADVAYAEAKEIDELTSYTYGQKE